MEFLNEFMVAIVMGICLCVGFMIKHAIPTDKINRWIPLIMAILGVIINVWLNFAFTPEILLGGLVSGLASTGLHQAFKKFIDKEE
jgi:hypothetical protein